MEEMITPYELPEVENHSFFFIDQRIETHVEAKFASARCMGVILCVTWIWNPNGRRYVTVFFGWWCGIDTAIHASLLGIYPFIGRQWRVRSLLDGCFQSLFRREMHGGISELRNRLAGLTFPVNALKLGLESSRIIRKILLRMNDMDELGRLCEMFRLLPVLFTSSDHTFAGKPMNVERDVRRIQQICTYVMGHYIHPISLDDISAEVGMNRSAFCSYFKRCKGMTFSRFVTEYRLNTACELLKHSQKQVSEICFAVGFNDVPLFNRIFKKLKGVTPQEYRKKGTSG